MLQKILWLSLAGACGTVSRFAVCELASKLKGGPIPLGTLAVNIIGSFFFGLLYTSAQSKLNLTPETRTILLVGFMGAFTTFSTFTFDTAKLLHTQQWFLAVGNVAGQVLLGVVALVAGVLVGRAL
ncbi:MAG: fluoride efflux transporter CrcB [Armatimonadota bacterium]|nr:fluoride efflux transporter CrcB [bacterium]